MATVSIIIPCFNHGLYLVQALQSILNQAYDDWEAIVVDDGSTDDTAESARGFQDQRIRYVYQENQGLATARNTGLKLAEGQYAAFLDADDEWQPQFLSQCVATLQAAPEAPGVYARNLYIDENSRQLAQVGGSVVEVASFRRRLLEGGFFPPCAVLVRCTALKISGLFDTTLKGSGTEDWDLWLRLSEQGAMIGIAEPLACYRVYAGSMSTNAQLMHSNRLAVLAKHFGPPTGEVEGWDSEKRFAYAFAHRAAGLAFLEQGQQERCWQELDEAARYWPAILARLDTYYELGCGRQPKGYRGRPTPTEIRANGSQALAWLARLFEHDEGRLAEQQAQAFGQAYLALGMLADQAGDWPLARGYLRQALRTDRRLLAESGFLRRLLKLHLGQRISGRIAREHDEA